MRLSWSLRTCARCGGERVAKRPCPECGTPAAPHEIQPDLDRRTKIVSEFRTRRREVSPNSFPDDLLVAVTTATETVLRALADVARWDRRADGLIDAFELLDQLVADTSQFRPRPHRNQGRREHQAVLRARMGLEQFLDALTSATPLDAQRHEAEGQRHLDAAGEVLAEVNRHDDLSEQLHERPLMEVLGADHGGAGTSFTDMFAALGPKLGLTGDDIGLQIAIDAVDLSTAVLDRARVLEVSDYVAGLLEDRSEVLEDHDWRTELLAAILTVDSQANTFVQVVDSEEHDLVVVQKALDLVVTVRERGLRAGVLALLVADGHGSLEKLSTRSAGHMLNTGERLLPGLRLDQLSRAVRDAGAHQDFQTDGEAVLLDRGRSRVTVEDFIDQVLAGLELHQGIMRGIYVAMARSGVRLPSPAELSSRERLDAVRYMFAAAGVRDVDMIYDGPTVKISGRGDTLPWASVVAGIVGILGKDVETVALELTTGEGQTVRGTAQLDAYREIEPDDDPTRSDAALLRFLKATSVTRFAGQNPLEVQVWAKIATHMSNERAGDSLADRVRRVISIRDVAREAEVDTAAIETLLAELRSLGAPTAGAHTRLEFAPLPKGTRPRT